MEDLLSTSDIQLICFDVDGTLLAGTIYIWQTLHDHFGTDPARRARAKRDFFAGEIDYASWFEHDIQLLRERGADRRGFRAVAGLLRPAPGAVETLAALVRRGYRLAIISGSIDVVLEQFFPEVPFTHVLINHLRFGPDGRLEGGTPTPYDMDGKADGLREIARREGLTPERCAFVGDNINDLAVMRTAGLSVGVFVKSPEVASAAAVVIEEPDLRALLPLFPDRTPG